LFDERITGNDGAVPTTMFFDTHADRTFSTAVLEPATWSMLILGFAGLGLGLRRRTGRAAA